MDGGDDNDIYLVYNHGLVGGIISDTGITGIDEIRFASTGTISNLLLNANDTGVEKIVIGTGTDAVADTSNTTTLQVNASFYTANALNIIGNDGDNVITGTTNNDSLSGNAGADQLFGANGNDTINSGNGDDRIIGGIGSDSLSGGLGSDLFDFNATNESLVGINRDVISDFNSVEFDLIDLATIDADIGLANNQAFTFIGNDVAFSNVAGQLRFVTASNSLFGDVNGDSIADFEIALTGVTSFSVSDFIL